MRSRPADPRARIRAAVVGVLTACLLTSCTNDPPSPTGTSAPEPPFTAGAAASLPEIDASPTPLWSASSGPQSTVWNVHLIGSDIVAASERPDGTKAVGTFDVTTGQPGWIHEELAGLNASTPELAHRLGDFVYLPEADALYVETEARLCSDEVVSCDDTKVTPEHGVVALSRIDGSALWYVPALAATPRADPQAATANDPTVRVAAADAEVVLIVIAPAGALAGSRYADPATVSTIALDAHTGQQLWVAPGVVGTGVADGTALCQIPPAGPVGEVIQTDDLGSACGLDLASGERTWTYDPQVDSSLVAATGSHAALKIVGESSAEPATTAVIDTGTGAVIEELGVPATSWFADDETLVGTQIDNAGQAHLISIGVDEDALQYAAKTAPRDQDLSLVSDGYVFFTGTKDGRPFTTATDRWGNPLGEKLPGQVLAADASHLLVRQGNPAKIDAIAGYAIES